MHPDSADSKQRQSARSDTTVLPRHGTHSAEGGNDKAVLVRRLDAFFREQAVGGSHIPRGERVRGGVCVCAFVCVIPVTCC